jgi:hypothetical protein
VKPEIIQRRSNISDIEGAINMKYRSSYTISVLFWFGVIVLLGCGCKKESVEKKVTILSLDELRAKAEEGDADAQYSLGMIYEEGAGVEKDEKAAAQWYEKAAAQGHTPARTKLAVLYSQGRGVEQDKQKGLALYLESAKQGNALAQCRLGWTYHTGWLGEKDNVKAVQWLSKSHEQGLLWATFQLGKMYQKGKGVERNFLQALKCFERALAKLDSWSFYGKELKYATDELYRVINKENLRIRNDLWSSLIEIRSLTFYQIGLDNATVQNYTEAYLWILLAGLEGRDVHRDKKVLAKIMTEEQIAAANKQAVEFLRKRRIGDGDFSYQEKIRDGLIIEYEIPESIWQDVEKITVPPQYGSKVKDRWQFQAVQDERCLYLRFTYHEPLPEISRNIVGKLQMSEEYLGHLPVVDVVCPPERMEDYKKQNTHLNHLDYPTLVRPYFCRPKSSLNIRCHFNLNYRYVGDDRPIRFIISNSFDPNDLERDCELIKFNLSSTILKYLSESNIKVQEELHYWFHGNEEDGIWCEVSLDQHNGERTGDHDDIYLGNHSNLIVYEDRSFIIRVPLTQEMFYQGEKISAFMPRPLSEVSLRIRPYGTDRYSLYFPKKVELESDGE